jgi:hypothetical protein
LAAPAVAAEKAKRRRKTVQALRRARMEALTRL